MNTLYTETFLRKVRFLGCNGPVVLNVMFRYPLRVLSPRSLIMSLWQTTEDGISMMKLRAPLISCFVNRILSIVRKLLSGL